MDLVQDMALPKTKVKPAASAKKKTKEESLDELLKLLQKEKTEKALSIRNAYDMPVGNQGHTIKSAEKKSKTRLKL